MSGKCPIKFFRYPFEGGEKCDPECAWLVTVDDMELCAVNVLVRANDDSAPENGVTDVREGANDGNADSREKLEAEITKQFSDWFGNSPYPSQGHRVAVSWLDRQAAITERGIRDELEAEMELYAARCRRVSELQAKVDALERERDYWKRTIAQMRALVDAGTVVDDDGEAIA